MKTCSHCRELKSLECFGPLKKAKDGLHSWCRQCLAEWRRNDRKDDPIRYANIDKQRKNKEERKLSARTRWAKNRDNYLARAAIRFSANKTIYNENRRKTRAKNPDYYRDMQRRWREANRDRMGEWRREAWKRATPSQKLRTYFGAAIAHALNGSGKGGRSWQDLVGYKTSDLKRHIERQFIKGMSWENYGKWHIDHIIPVASFKFETVDDDAFKACWSLTNLRPLWAAENIRKKDYRTHLI